MDLKEFGDFQSIAARAGIIFFHQGEFNESIVTAAAHSLRERLDEEGASGPAKRKLFSTFIEMAQNITHYAADTFLEERHVKSGVIAVGKENADSSNFWIVCSNLVDIQHVPRITEKLESVKSMTLEEIKKAYKSQLHNENHEASDEVSKGAGLGWLTIARDSAKPIEYSFSSEPRYGSLYALFFVKAVI